MGGNMMIGFGLVGGTLAVLIGFGGIVLLVLCAVIAGSQS